MHLQSRCPDAIIENKHGESLRAEFEFDAGNFRAHGHDPKSCDIIISWKASQRLHALPVFELRKTFVSLDREQQISIREELFAYRCKDLIRRELAVRNGERYLHSARISFEKNKAESKEKHDTEIQLLKNEIRWVVRLTDAEKYLLYVLGELEYNPQPCIF